MFASTRTGLIRFSGQYDPDRKRLRGGLGCKAGDEGSLMLMWEDGYCRPVTGAVASCEGATTDAAQVHHHQNHGIHRIHSNSSLNLGDDVEEDDPVRRAFRKMSIQLYNYGEGLMGKVASDKCHKWVFRETSETEAGPLNYWQSSFDSHPPEWTDQFSAGIQTIAVIQAGHGLLQLGSCKIVAEDLHFVLRMRYTFESLENHAGGFMSQTFAPMRSRFFCGTSPNAAASAAAAAVSPGITTSHSQPPSTAGWTTNNNTSPAFFQPTTTSDFRLRLGVSADHHHHHHQATAASQDFLRNDDGNNITSLRLSLQNATSTNGDHRSLGFDFRTDADVTVGGGDGSTTGHGCFTTSGIKRPGDPGPAGPEDRPNLLSRRMQFNKMSHHHHDHHHHMNDNSTTTLQQLLESNNHSGMAFSAPYASGNDLDHPSLMLQIPPPVISSNDTSPMISPRTKMPRSGNTSPLAIRLSKFTEQFNTGGGSSSHPGTPKPHSSSDTTLPLHSQFNSGSRPSTPSNSYLPPSHPGTPKMTPTRTSITTTAEMLHFAATANGSGSHPPTPKHHHHPGDNFLNDNTTGNANGGHSMMLDTTPSSYADTKHNNHLLMPVAPWENLKDALEMPSNSTDFMMDGFFE